jgi:hypothetical protein
MRTKQIMITILTWALLFSCGSYTYARMFSNSTENAFYEADTTSVGDTTLACPSTIEELVIKGAGYFFKAQANITLLSEKVELSDLDGVDFNDLQETANKAFINLNIARYYYQELQDKANHTPYNQVVIDKLLAFNYDSFQAEHALLNDIFINVKGYLVNGDVRGVYNHTATYLDSLIDILTAIKINVDAGTIPTNADMWNLNQVCVKAHMFGQYIARVMDSIVK